MRRLVLMRHAQTEGNHAHGDRARRLLPSGVEDARATGVLLGMLGLEYALVSSATRTRETFAALGLAIPAEFHDALYHGGTETMLQRIGETLDDVSGLLVIGHAPTIPSLSAELAYASAPAEADALQCWFPAGAFSEFTFDGSWDDLAAGRLGQVSLERVERGR